jgi:catechol 2,3-dioxygenase-like lactoylglutathione lyase family enzyme
MNYRLELVQVPVSDVDVAKAFYVDQVGFHADHDHRVTEELRFVQLTPPGSACSIALGTGLGTMEPGSVQGLQLVVDDLAALLARSADRVLTHRAILKAVWGPNAVDQPEHLWVLMAQLRKKIEPEPSHPRYLVSEPWVGYRFVAGEEG